MFEPLFGQTHADGAPEGKLVNKVLESFRNLATFWTLRNFNTCKEWNQCLLWKIDEKPIQGKSKNLF